MGGIFSKPKEPDLPSPPPAPTLEDPAVKQQAAEEAARLRRRRGLGSTILTKPGLGETDAPVTRTTALGGL